MRIQNIGSNAKLFIAWVNVEVINLTYVLNGKTMSTKENSVCWIMKNVWGNEKVTNIEEEK